MTTFEKMYASLKQDNEFKQICNKKLILNKTLILIRDIKTSDLQKKYWEEENNKRIVTTKLDLEKEEVEYQIDVRTLWENPECCNQCFPKNYLEEMPLVETNRVSVIPSMQFGQCCESEAKSETKYDLTHFNHLFGNVLYKHLERNGNHFQFYLETDKIFRAIINDSSLGFAEWLKNIKIARGKNICNIIISPMHYSNAGFLNEVNSIVFDENALIVYLEVEKEFRDNFATKYKYITNQISKFEEVAKASREKYSFNFYFVDDTIVSGTKFERATSLAKSLIPSGTSNVDVNIFAGVMLLINRCSNNSKLNFVKSESDFYSFINFKIPSMRHHEDACTLCKTSKEAYSLYEKSSTNKMAFYWEERSDKHKLIFAQEFYKTEENDCKIYKRLVAAYVAHSYLNKCNDRNLAKEHIYTMLKKCIDGEFLTNYSREFKNDSDIDIVEKTYWILSFINVLSRPFLAFRKTTKESIFTIMLKMLDQLISDDKKENSVKEQNKNIDVYYFDLLNNLLEATGSDSITMIGLKPVNAKTPTDITTPANFDSYPIRKVEKGKGISDVVIFTTDYNLVDIIIKTCRDKSYYIDKDTVYVMFYNRPLDTKYSKLYLQKQTIDRIVLKITYLEGTGLPKMLFNLRALLSQRSKFIKKIEEDFNNNLMQVLMEVNNSLRLLQRIDNVSHASNSVKEKCINNAFNYVEKAIKGLQVNEIEEALFLSTVRLMSDIVISGLYYKKILQDFRKKEEGDPKKVLK